MNVLNVLGWVAFTYYAIGFCWSVYVFAMWPKELLFLRDMSYSIKWWYLFAAIGSCAIGLMA